MRFIYVSVGVFVPVRYGWRDCKTGEPAGVHEPICKCWRTGLVKAICMQDLIGETYACR